MPFLKKSSECANANQNPPDICNVHGLRYIGQLIYDLRSVIQISFVVHTKDCTVNVRSHDITGNCSSTNVLLWAHHLRVSQPCSLPIQINLNVYHAGTFRFVLFLLLWKCKAAFNGFWWCSETSLAIQVSRVARLRETILAISSL